MDKIGEIYGSKNSMVKKVELTIGSVYSKL